jgi:hypothetical protein
MLTRAFRADTNFTGIVGIIDMAPKVLKTAQAGLAALAVSTLPFAGAASAEDAQSVSSAKTVTTAELEAIMERNQVIKDAAAFPLTHPYQIGISILEKTEGLDETDISATVIQNALESGFSGQYQLGSKTFVGDNGGNETEINLAYAYRDSDGKLDVMVRGPYNALEVVDAAREVATILNGLNIRRDVSYAPN